MIVLGYAEKAVVSGIAHYFAIRRRFLLSTKWRAARVSNPERDSPSRAAASSTIDNTRAGMVTLTPDCLAGKFCDVNVNQRPNSTGVVGVGLMDLQVSLLWNRLAVHEQAFDVAGDGFTSRGDSLLWRVTRREAPRQIGHRDPIASCLGLCAAQSETASALLPWPAILAEDMA